MEFRKRAVVGTIWLVVAALMAITVDPSIPSSANQAGRMGVVALALFLAIVYYVDPWNVVTKGPFEYRDEETDVDVE